MKTKSEGLFEGFLVTNNLSFEKIEVDTTPRPDYRVSVVGGEIIFELKELAVDGNFGVIKTRPSPKSRTVHALWATISGAGSKAQKNRSNLGPSKAFPQFF